MVSPSHIWRQLGVWLVNIAENGVSTPKRLSIRVPPLIGKRMGLVHGGASIFTVHLPLRSGVAPDKG
ncbi:hypothetical protein BA896_008060 [Janthinobacterium lividum]|uniref:Uncharacterized protein n=2 Tax=Janthinobacterium TaxID=29580 RepID=A0A1E8PRI2_9BURK|nr:hypothetical protein BA896_008060 [Janthinobacterium lividum]